MKVIGIFSIAFILLIQIVILDKINYLKKDIDNIDMQLGSTLCFGVVEPEDTEN